MAFISDIISFLVKESIKGGAPLFDLFVGETAVSVSGSFSRSLAFDRKERLLREVASTRGSPPPLMRACISRIRASMAFSMLSFSSLRLASNILSALYNAYSYILRTLSSASSR